MYEDNDDRFHNEDRAEEVLSNLNNNEDDEENQDEEGDSLSTVEDMMSDVEKRIEEANLFKLLISHSFFSQDSARPEVLKSVNKKIKHFAINELELLLGVKTKEPAIKVVPQSQFNAEEVIALKSLASKVLGKPSSAPAVVPAERKPEIVTISAPTPKVNSLPTPVLIASSNKQVKQSPTPKAAKSTKPKKQREFIDSNGNKVKSEDKGFATPNKETANLVKKMPNTQQLAQLYMASPSKPEVSTGTAMLGNGSSNFESASFSMNNLIQQLTGGSVVHTDNSVASDTGEDINGRF
jgi:hypothetical protein